MSAPLTPDEQAVLSVLATASGPLTTVEIGDRANPLRAYSTNNAEQDAWAARTRRLEAAELSLHITGLIAGTAVGWRITVAGHVALMLALESAAAGGDR